MKAATHNLQFHGLSFELNGSNLKVDTNGTYIALRVRVVGEPKEETRLRSKSAPHWEL